MPEIAAPITRTAAPITPTAEPITRTVEPIATMAEPIATTAEPITRTRAARRFNGRRVLGTGIAVVVGLVLLSGMTRLITPTASSGPTATDTARAEATASQRTPVPTATPTERPLAPTGKTLQAKVIQVVDGDTIFVLLGGKYVTVRYIGIETPAVVNPKSPTERGSEALAANADLVAGQQVFLETDRTDRDRDGRLLRYVWRVEGERWIMVNLELVRLGLARAVSSPPNTRHDESLAAAQQEAKAAGRGRWAPSPSPTPTPP